MLLHLDFNYHSGQTVYTFECFVTKKDDKAFEYIKKVSLNMQVP